MRMTLALVGVVLGSSALYAAYVSALAPYPWKKSGFAPPVEELLGKLESKAAKCQGFSATVTWTADPGLPLEVDREKYGPLSLKSAFNWHSPNGAGFWAQGTFALQVAGASFVVEKPKDDASPADWWFRDGEHLYSRAWSVDWPTIWRFHHDALEADMLGYCEGPGLLLWAAAPGEYLRRGDRLVLGEDRVIAGKTRKTLVATPEWIARPLFLENRKSYPFNHSTLLTWAVHRPVVTYLIDPESDSIVGAEFAYYDCLRDNPDDWNAIARPNGIVVTCMAEALAELEAGVQVPTKITGEVFADGKLLRRTVLEVALAAPPAALTFPSLPAGKRMIDPWPFYRSEVFVQMAERGELNHANLLGLARAFAFEKRIQEARNCMLQTVAELEGDATLAGETFGGIDWELGFALREYFRWGSDADVLSLWNSLPRSPLWRTIMTRGIALEREFEPEAKERVAALQTLFNQAFLEGIVVERATRLLEFRRADLLRRAQRDEDAGMRERAAAYRARAESLTATTR